MASQAAIMLISNKIEIDRSNAERKKKVAPLNILLVNKNT